MDKGGAKAEKTYPGPTWGKSTEKALKMQPSQMWNKICTQRMPLFLPHDAMLAWCMRT